MGGMRGRTGPWARQAEGVLVGGVEPSVLGGPLGFWETAIELRSRRQVNIKFSKRGRERILLAGRVSAEANRGEFLGSGAHRDPAQPWCFLGPPCDQTARLAPCFEGSL